MSRGCVGACCISAVVSGIGRRIGAAIARRLMSPTDCVWISEI